MKKFPGSKMPPTRKPRNQRPSLGDEHYASLNLQAIVTAPNEVSANETYTDESEEDIYDNREDDSLDPFAHPPRMPRYDFAKRKLSQLIGIIFKFLKCFSSTWEANIW